MTDTPITEQAFRKDETALADTQRFFLSASGQKFLGALETAHPLRALADPRTRTPHGVRDTALVESGTPQTADNLLGTIKGYEQCLGVIQSLRQTWEESLPPTEPRRNRVTKALRHE